MVYTVVFCCSSGLFHWHWNSHMFVPVPPRLQDSCGQYVVLSAPGGPQVGPMDLAIRPVNMMNQSHQTWLHKSHHDVTVNDNHNNNHSIKHMCVSWTMPLFPIWSHHFQSGLPSGQLKWCWYARVSRNQSSMLIWSYNVAMERFDRKKQQAHPIEYAWGFGGLHFGLVSLSFLSDAFKSIASDCFMALGQYYDTNNISNSGSKVSMQNQFNDKVLVDHTVNISRT